MASAAANSHETCLACGAPLHAAMRLCPTCRADAGAPNVRRCRTKENLEALDARYEAARARASGMGCLKEFDVLKATIEQESGVVVSMPAGAARQLFEDPELLYDNYEHLVGAKARKPAAPDNDRHRCAVGALLFGSYADEIVYGALSLGEEGLPTYGDVHCRLRSVTVEKRTSFLETNSFRFVKVRGITPGTPLPLGRTACWEHRHRLVLAKLADSLSPGQTESDWQAILLQSDGQSRENDDFVEAHIYDGFDKHAIESMVRASGKKLGREAEMDIEIAMSRFNSFVGRKA